MNVITSNGFQLRLLEDTNRNQFYESIIRDNVKGKNCVDVGFGTGLLSMLAIKHGANHITAYESDTEHYMQARELISHLGLFDKITLFNTTAPETFPDDKVVFHEIVGSTLWEEGVYAYLKNQTVLPSVYTTKFMLFEVPKGSLEKLFWDYGIGSVDRIQREFWLQQIPQSQFKSISDIEDYQIHLLNHSMETQRNTYEKIRDRNRMFDPGITVDPAWHEYIYKYIRDGLEKLKEDHTKFYPLDVKTVSDFDQQLISLFNNFKRNTGKEVASITVTADQEYYPESKSVKIDVRTNPEFEYILMPFMSMSHHKHCLDLDNAHWNHRIRWAKSLIFRQAHTIKITQNFTNSSINYKVF